MKMDTCSLYGTVWKTLYTNIHIYHLQPWTIWHQTHFFFWHCMIKIPHWGKQLTSNNKASIKYKQKEKILFILIQKIKWGRNFPCVQYLKLLSFPFFLFAKLPFISIRNFQVPRQTPCIYKSRHTCISNHSDFCTEGVQNTALDFQVVFKSGALPTAYKNTIFCHH